MGCSPSSLETRHNRSIDLAQHSAKKNMQQDIRVLLFGTGDSGKTTLRKQLVNLHGERFKDPPYRRTFNSIVIENLLEGTIVILNTLNHEKYAETIEVLKDEIRIRATVLSEKTAETLKNIFDNDEDFREARVTQKNAINLQDCWDVFADEFTSTYPKWGGQDWIPSTEDCIRSRTRTSGVVQENVNVDGANYCIVDVGGQRAERRKWMHMFEDITAAIFVTSLSEYDQGLFEDQSKNRLEEAFELFQACMETQWLSKSVLILFLNKKDLFDQKFLVDKIPLNISGRFPDAPTGNMDAAAAIGWISRSFESRRRIHKTAPMFIHVTTATDEKNVKKVFDTCKTVITTRALRDVGMLLPNRDY